jgi:polysaccharide pyruvyl transferase WcaK-like protein
VIGDPAILLSEQVVKKFLAPAPLRIGLNLNYSGWLGFGQWREDILRAYRETAQYFQVTYGAEIYYLQHHPGERQIYLELKIANLQFIDLSPRQQKFVYGQLDLVIGMMLHAGVLACGAGTPEISVAYDLRNYSFAEFIGCPELVVDLDKLRKGELLKMAKKVFANRRHYHTLFRRIKSNLWKRQTKFLSQVTD